MQGWDLSLTYQMYSHKQLYSWVYDDWHFHAKGQYLGEVIEVVCKKWLPLAQ